MTIKLATATAFTDWLAETTKQAAADETRAAYLARVAKARPLPIVITRYQCPYCRRTRSKEAAAAAHIARCWQNPAARGCKTCRHFEPTSEGPYPEHPGWPEECGAGEGIELERPITDCPFWEPNTQFLPAT